MTVAIDEAAIVLGSARGDGNTRTAIDLVFGGPPVHCVDLSQFHISTYDYSHVNSGDAFVPLIESLLVKPLWVLATPVYWYTMSAPMKVFLDRVSDLITVRKDLGRQLRVKSIAVVACGIDPELPEGFEAPFKMTCNYLGMHYLGAFYLPFGDDDKPSAAKLAAAREWGASLIAP